MWGGKLRFTTPMLFAIGLVAMFTIGGLSGVTHAVVAVRHPADRHVLHRRPLPLRALRRRAPRLPRRHLLLVAEGRSATCSTRSSASGTSGLIAHRLQPDVRADAHPRPPGHAAAHLHLRRRATGSTSGTWSSTIGAFIIAVSMLVFVANILRSWRQHRANPVNPGPDPWDARSLEWMSPVADAGAQLRRGARPCRTSTSSGTASTREDEQGTVGAGRHRPAEVAQPGDGTGVHLPSPSYWPLVLAVGLPLIGYGLIFNLGLAAGRRPDRRHRRLRLGLRAGRRSRGPPRAARPRRARRRARRRRGRARTRRRGRRRRRRPTAKPPKPSPRAWRVTAPAPTRRRPPMTETATAPHTEDADLHDNGVPSTTRPAPASRTRSWRCGCSSGPSACSSAASSRPTCSTPPLRSTGPGPAGRLRHPVHVGVSVRAADELAHDGAGASARSTGATSAACRTSGCSPRPCSARSSSPARSTSSRRSCKEGLGFTTNIFGSRLLHAHRLPRRARQRRHRHAAVAVRAVAAGRPAGPTGPRPSRSSASTGTSSTSCGS